MWNPFRRKNKKRQKKALQNLRDLHEMVGILDKWARHGLIFWRRKDNILIIEEYVALLKLAEGRKGFLNFLNQIVVWQNSKLIDEAYESHRAHVETEAVRKAQHKFANLTKADIMRIRQEARCRCCPLSNLNTSRSLTSSLSEPMPHRHKMPQKRAGSSWPSAITTARRWRWHCMRTSSITY